MDLSTQAEITEGFIEGLFYQKWDLSFALLALSKMRG